jgi:hypothetical protein
MRPSGTALECQVKGLVPVEEVDPFQCFVDAARASDWKQPQP